MLIFVDSLPSEQSRKCRRYVVEFEAFNGRRHSDHLVGKHFKRDHEKIRLLFKRKKDNKQTLIKKRDFITSVKNTSNKSKYNLFFRYEN